MLVHVDIQQLQGEDVATVELVKLASFHQLLQGERAALVSVRSTLHARRARLTAKATAKMPTGQQLLAWFIAPRAVTHLVTELGACMVHTLPAAGFVAMDASLVALLGALVAMGASSCARRLAEYSVWLATTCLTNVATQEEVLARMFALVVAVRVSTWTSANMPASSDVLTESPAWLHGVAFLCHHVPTSSLHAPLVCASQVRRVPRRSTRCFQSMATRQCDFHFSPAEDLCA